MDTATNTEGLHLGCQLLQALLLVSAGNVHGEDLFDPAPVYQEGEGRPATLAGNNFRWDASREELAGSTNAETVAINGGHAGCFPDGGADAEEESFGRDRVTAGGSEGEEGSVAGDVRVHGEVEGKSLEWAEVVVARSQDKGSTLLLGRLGPGDMERGAGGGIAVGLTDDVHRA